MSDHAHQFRGDTLLGGMVLEKCQEEGCGKMRFVRYQEPRGLRVCGLYSEQVVKCHGEIPAPYDFDCSSCGEEMPIGECPDSRRRCGHHCNHSWSHDHCDWCGKNFVCCNECGKDMALSDTALEGLIADGGDVLCAECLDHNNGEAEC